MIESIKSLKSGGWLKLLSVGTVLFATQLGLGCIWWVMEGVHFKYPAMDFSRPPRQYAHHYEDSDGWRPGTAFLSEGENSPSPISHRLFEDEVDGSAIRAHRVASASALEANHKFGSALKAWQDVLHNGYISVADVRERVEVLRLLANNPNLQGSAEVLAGIPLEGHSASMPSPSSVALELRPFAAYYGALTVSKQPMPVAEALANVAGTYPRSPIAESALISIPRLLLSKKAGEPSNQAKKLSIRAMMRLESVYPKSRFKPDISGWRGRLLYLDGDFAGALQCYRRQLAQIPAGGSVWRATDSIALCERKLGRTADGAIAILIRYARSPEPKEKDSSTRLLENAISSLKGASAEDFGHQIRSNPELLADYLDYRLDFTDPTPELLRFEHASCLASASTNVRSHVFARLAESAFRLKQMTHAERLAGHVSEGSPSDLALAGFIRGSIARKQGRYAQAIRDFERIVRDGFNSYVVGSAMENLALLYESHGRLGEALDIYRKLSYAYDVNYMVDIRMSPSQLRTYIDDHPKDPQRNLLKYSLGFRLMRTHDWDGAGSVFKSLAKKTRLKLLNKAEIRDYYEENNPVQDPLETARDLQKLSRKVSRADGSNARATAMLAEASYFYDRRNLLLYNGALWKGTRSYVFAFSWNDKAASKADNDAIGRHHWEHECLAQAYLLCRQVVESKADLGTRTRAAYVGACAGERLSKMNEFWRWKNTQVNVMGSAVQLMKTARSSPNSWLAARATKYVGVFEAERKQSHEEEYARKPGGSVYKVGWGY